jgi:hypothetical protein
MLQNDLELVKTHVINSENRIRNQRKVIAILAARRQPLQQAQGLLHLFEVTWQAHVDHLAELQKLIDRQLKPRREMGFRSRCREASEERRVRSSY